MSMSRRKFSHLAAAAGAGSVIGARSRSKAQSAAPVRFLALRSPHGTDRDFWIPKTNAARDPEGRDMALSALTFEYDNAILSPLQGWRDRITILDGIDTRITKEKTRGDRRNAHGHNEQGVMLTGAQPPADRNSAFYEGHSSLDFFLHQRLKASFLITAGVRNVGGSWKSMSFNDGGRAIARQVSPRDIYQKAFAGYTPPDPNNSVDYTAGEKAIAVHTRQALQRLEGRLSGTEIEKIRSHRNAVVDPTGSSMMGTRACMAGAASDFVSHDRPEGYQLGQGYQGVAPLIKNYAKVITQAFACDRARCATFRMLDDGAYYFNQYVTSVGHNTDNFHNGIVHGYWDNKSLRAPYTAGVRWSAMHFRMVLEELDSVIDPLDPDGGSILDNTIVYWHNEFGHEGHDAQHTRHPIVIAGGGGKKLKLGRYLRFRDGLANAGKDKVYSENKNVMVPHNKVLVSIAHAMGATDVDYFGDRDLSDNADYRGPLAALMA